MHRRILRGERERGEGGEGPVRPTRRFFYGMRVYSLRVYVCISSGSVGFGR